MLHVISPLATVSTLLFCTLIETKAQLGTDSTELHVVEWKVLLSNGKIR